MRDAVTVAVDAILSDYSTSASWIEQRLLGPTLDVRRQH
jgi:hypothetical protein